MNKTNPKMSTRPPVPQSADEFIMEADLVTPPQPKVKSISEERYPWLDPSVRDDVIKSVNLRLREESILKLQYLSTKTNKSQQDIIREVLLPHIEAEINRIINLS